ncbi:hypothetical protein NQ317_011716, partial [Molorchus minor]
TGPLKYWARVPRNTRNTSDYAPVFRYKQRQLTADVHKGFVSRVVNTMKRKILLLSSSKVHGYDYLEYAENDICDLLNKNKVSTICFIPYALSDHDSYLKKVEKPFKKWGYQVKGVHNGDPLQTIKDSEAIFVGGGNTFRLLKILYDLNLIQAIRKKVLLDGIPYIGTSAGLVPFNINPHYQDADPNSKHQGRQEQKRFKSTRRKNIQELY